MKAVSGKEFARILEHQGWVLKRIHGSHHINGKAGSIIRISVPIHGSQPLKIGMLKHFMKMAELEDSDLS
jgi:predicted RNA binding protein YcfA (HicA-like mRNA interferase family)